MSVDLLDGDEVRHRADHSPDLGAVFFDYDVTDSLQTERAHRVALAARATDDRLSLRDFEASHHAPIPAARALSSPSGATSSSGSPRRAATCSGRSRPRRPATVACTMLM